MNRIPSLEVAIVGFSTLETLKLEKILGQSQTRDRRYSVLDSADAARADILLVNSDDSAALQHGKLLAEHPPQSRLVLIGAHPQQAQGRPFIAKPILSARFVELLDQIAYPPAPASTPAFEAPPHLKREPPPPRVEPAASRPAQAYRVLVVDDSELVHKALAIELRQALPHSVLDCAGSGEEALDKIQRETLYDLIFLDIMMPGIDGYDTCKAIRKDTRYKSKIPIIMLSAKSSPMDEVKGVIAGCTTYLVKPIVHESFQTLLRRVGAWLDHRGGAAQESVPPPPKPLAVSGISP